MVESSKSRYYRDFVMRLFPQLHPRLQYLTGFLATSSGQLLHSYSSDDTLEKSCKLADILIQSMSRKLLMLYMKHSYWWNSEMSVNTPNLIVRLCLSNVSSLIAPFSVDLDRRSLDRRVVIFTSVLWRPWMQRGRRAVCIPHAASFRGHGNTFLSTGRLIQENNTNKCFSCRYEKYFHV